MVGTNRRWLPACAIALLCLALGGPLPALADGTRSGVAGTIKDSVGHVLDGVEILIVEGASNANPAAQLAPIAKVSSDAWGRFAIPDLTPGLYGLAALKTGYRTYIGNVDTRVDRVIDVVLFPMPDRGSLLPGTVPDDAAWLLRLPRRTVFRETEAGVESADGSEAEVAAVSPPDVPIQMRVDQLFAVGAPFPSQRGEPVKLQGNETRVRLATSLGERGNLRLDGRRESLGSTLRTDAATSASSESAGLSVDFSYDTSLDSRFSLKAFFDAKDLEWNSAAALPFGSRRKSWGYESEWQKQLGDQSSLRVGVDYNDDSLRLPDAAGLPGEAGTLAAPGSPGIDRAMARRTVVAGGAYESMAADRHQLQVAFKARLLDSPDGESRDPALPAFWQRGRGDPGRGNDGWSLRLNAQDSWAMTGPFTLLYGLDYQHALTDRDTAVVVPSMGGAWAIDRVAMRFTLSYHAVAQWDETPRGSKYDLRQASLSGSPGLRGGRDEFLPTRDLGYQAEVELPVTGTLRLKGASSFVPIQLEGIGGPLLATSAIDTRNSGSFLSDGTTAVGETSLSLVHDLGDARTWFELSRGQAQGMLVLGSDHHGSLPTLTLGELTYDNGAWGFQMIPSGTDLRVLYKRVVESEGRDHEARPINERETVELQLIQNLMRFHGLGNWRLLMAVRMDMQDSDDDERWASGTDPAILRAFNEGVSAGLSVTF